MFVDLAALIVVGSSTHPSGSGNENLYQGKFIPADGDIVHVNFFSGPAGIEQALRDHVGENNVVLASGWGASNASHVLATNRTDPNVTSALWVLDNNLNNPNGGFATRYPLFSRLVGIDPTPTPTDTGAPVVDVRYEYDINSDAPAYPLNVVAMANSVVAYLYGHLNQANLELPVNADGSPTCATPCTVTTSDGTVVHLEKVGSVTYVTYETKSLPLLRPIRDFVPVVGNPVAD
jgi:PE-PPE domain-containing protein